MPRKIHPVPATLVLVCAFGTVEPAPAAAASPGIGAAIATIQAVSSRSLQDMVTLLRRSGYTVVEVRRTMLGRLRIRAQNGQHMREIVISRSTGEIKRDAVIEVFGGGGSVGGSGSRSSNSTGGGGTGTESAGVSASSSGGGASASASSSGASVSVGGASVSVGGGGISVGN